MRKILCVVLLVSISISVLSQELHNKEYYLQKSKKQKTTSLILITGGVIVGIIGLTQIDLAGDVDGEVNNTPGAILFATGGVATIAGLIIFSKSNKNKKRAMTATTSININTNPFASIARVKHFYPSLNIKIQL